MRFFGLCRICDADATAIFANPVEDDMIERIPVCAEHWTLLESAPPLEES